MTNKKEVFLSKISNSVSNTWIEYSVLSSIVLAQSILESGWGESELAQKGFNLFGIKADSSWKGSKIKLPTNEYKNGIKYKTTAYFRKYNNWEESILDHAKFLSTQKRYAKVIGNSDYKSACEELYKAGYATNPQYAKLLISVIESNNLTKYDKDVKNDMPKEIELHAGHWSALNSGANGLINEVTEARRVGKRIFEILKSNKVPVTYFEDNTSKNQSQNLNTLVKHHNQDKNGIVVSIHFNASSGTTASGIGTEVLYSNQKQLATEVSNAISKASGLKNRGAKQRTNLAVLTRTYEPAILPEICFVNSKQDVELYQKNFEAICYSIAEVLASFIGYRINNTVNNSPAIQIKTNDKGEDEIMLNETARKETRELIKRAASEGVFDRNFHTDARINGYSDGELISYALIYVNRVLKK